MARVSLWRAWLPTILVVAALASVPLFASRLVLSMAIIVGIHGIVAVGQNLLMGYGGQVSLGQAAFYGIGAYASGVLTTRFELSPWVAIGAGVVIAAAVAYVVGLPTFRLEGLYLSLATMGVGVIIYIILVEWVSVTKGHSGITAIPYLNLFGFDFGTRERFYYLVLASAVPAVLAAKSLVNSRVGRALKAIHGSEAAAAALGIDVGRLKLHTFVTSAMYAAVAGSLYAHYVTFIEPTTFSYMESIYLVMISIVGGAASIAGAFVGAAVMTFLQELLREVLPAIIPGAGGDVELLFLGLLLVVIMIWMPDGVTPTGIRLWSRLWGQGRRPVSGQAVALQTAEEGVAKRGAARG